MAWEYEEIGISYTTTSVQPPGGGQGQPYFPDNSLYYNGSWWPQGLQFGSPEAFAYIQTSPTTYTFYIFSTSVLDVTTDPTQYQQWLSTYVPAPATPPAIAFNGTDYLGAHDVIGYQPVFWEKIYVASTLTVTPPSTTATFNLFAQANGNISTGPQTLTINFTDTDPAARPQISFESEAATATDSFGHTVNLSTSQIAALEAAGTFGTPANSNKGSINFTYNPQGTSLNFLTAGETAIVNYSINVADQDGNNQVSNVSVTVNGPKTNLAGFDVGQFPGLQTMQWLKSNTNLKWVDYYLTPAPSQSNALGWMGNRAALQGQGWLLEPIYVGRQSGLDPTQSANSLIENQITPNNSAATQGIHDADNTQGFLEVEGFAHGTTVYLDVESGKDPTSGSTPAQQVSYVAEDTALQSYIASWCAEISADGYNPGVYCPAGSASTILGLVPTVTLMIANTSTTATNSPTMVNNIDTTSSAGYVFSEAAPSGSNVPSAAAWQYVHHYALFAAGLADVDLDTMLKSNSAASITGSGRADIPWYNASTGQVGAWQVDGAVPQWVGIGTASTTVKAAAIGDFTGNGTSDILWENPGNGIVGDWLMNNGTPTWQQIGQGSTTMNIAGVGDFYGNGTSDILWQNPTNNLVGEWQMNNNVPTWQLVGQGSTTMKIAGIGDFNGDGKSDILWENPTNNLVGVWGMNGSTPTWSLVGQGSTTMNIVGVGDFNGAGTADVLWENPTNGVVGFWGMTNGQATSWNVLGTANTSYQVAGIGDYYGNGTDEILWRNGSTGDVGVWAMNNGQAAWHDLGISSTAFNTVRA